MSVSKANGYREVLKDDESLSTFLRAMHDFDEAFCKAMNDGSDFTLRMEVHGASGHLIHCRVTPDVFQRPRGSKVQEGRAVRKLLATRIA